MLFVVRFPLPSAAEELGLDRHRELLVLRIVFGSWQWNMTPLLRVAHPGPPLHCSPTNRYSTRSR